MLGRLLNWLRPKLPDDPWSVSVVDAQIVTSDGQGSQRKMAVDDLQAGTERFLDWLATLPGYNDRGLA